MHLPSRAELIAAISNAGGLISGQLGNKAWETGDFDAGLLSLSMAVGRIESTHREGSHRCDSKWSEANSRMFKARIGIASP